MKLQNVLSQAAKGSKSTLAEKLKRNLKKGFVEHHAKQRQYLTEEQRKKPSIDKPVRDLFAELKQQVYLPVDKSAPVEQRLDYKSIGDKIKQSSDKAELIEVSNEIYKNLSSWIDKFCQLLSIDQKPFEDVKSAIKEDLQQNIKLLNKEQLFNKYQFYKYSFSKLEDSKNEIVKETLSKKGGSLSPLLTRLNNSSEHDTDLGDIMPQYRGFESVFGDAARFPSKCDELFTAASNWLVDHLENIAESLSITEDSESIDKANKLHDLFNNNDAIKKKDAEQFLKDFLTIMKAPDFNFENFKSSFMGKSEYQKIGEIKSLRELSFNAIKLLKEQGLISGGSTTSNSGSGFTIKWYLERFQRALQAFTENVN